MSVIRETRLLPDGGAEFVRYARITDSEYRERWCATSLSIAASFSQMCPSPNLPENCACTACEITTAVRRAKKKSQVKT